MSLDELFCYVDEFCAKFLPAWEERLIAKGVKKRKRATRLSISEIITILILFQRSRYRDFKTFYLKEVLARLNSEFPQLVSYNRFVELIPRVLVPMCAYLQSRKAVSEGIAFVDSTVIVVCKPKRINQHKVFKGLAKLGKSSMGWFYGFKLHLICNHKGELVSCKITAGNIDDRKPLPTMASGLTGKLFADKGYISRDLFIELLENNLQLVTGIRKNMKNKLLSIFDKIMLRKRAIIESVNNQLKNVFQLEHTRHRSPINAFVHMIGALIAFVHHGRKPKIGELTKTEVRLMCSFMGA